MSTTGGSFSHKTMFFEKYDKTLKFEVINRLIINIRYGILLDKKNIDHLQKYFIKMLQWLC
jgi:hypothetical protein